MTPRRKRRRYDRPIVMTPAMFATVRREAHHAGDREAQARLAAYARRVQAAPRPDPEPVVYRSWMA